MRALARRLAATAAQPSILLAGAEPPELDEDDVAVYRSRIAALLRPYETPLDALRRLGGGEFCYALTLCLDNMVCSWVLVAGKALNSSIPGAGRVLLRHGTNSDHGELVVEEGEVCTATL